VPTARVNGIDIWYELAGDGPTLVMTHGFAGPYLPPIVDEIRPRFRLLQYHVRGHGRTTVPDNPAAYSVPQFAADLAGLMDHLGIEKAHVGGVSMGGMITAQFGCDYPERLQSLLLFDTMAGNGGDDEEAAEADRWFIETFERLEEIVSTEGLAGLVERENRWRHERDQYAHLRPEPLEEQDAINARKLEDMTPEGYIYVNRALRARPDLTSRTPGIAAPTLVSCGEWDSFYPCARRDAGLIPNSRFATIRRAAHDTLWYQPGLWKRALLDFIDDVEAGRDVRGAVEYAPEAAGQTA
jgi:pimeloyl-ACP methyl ester carboxylesterase